MELGEAILLGVVQGLTEFLPVSSSGHLVLAQEVLRVNPPGVALEVTVHLATLLAIVAYYRRRIVSLAVGALSSDPTRRGPAWRYLGFLVLGSVPAGLAGFLLKSSLEDAFESPVLASALLCVTGVFLLTTALVPGGRAQPVTWGRSLLIGIAQAAAILPGISRSGSTVSMALWAGMEGEEAAEFSFLLGCPAIAGAGLVTLLKAGTQTVAPLPLAAAFAASGVTGYLALVFFVRLLEKRKLHWFGPYCLVAGAAFLVWFLVRG